MAFFVRKYIPELYIAQNSDGGNVGFVAFIIPPNGIPPGEDPELQDALENTSYNGIFVFSAYTPVINTADAASTFVADILQRVPAQYRSINWIHDPGNIPTSTVDSMCISDDGTSNTTALQATLTTQLILNVPSGMGITLSGTTLQFNGTQFINFSGSAGPSMKPVASAFLDFSGSFLGCICFEAFIMRNTIMVDPQNPVTNGLMLGFQYLFPDKKDPINSAIPGFFPFAQALPPADYPGFAICIDPTDPFNQAFDPGFSTSPTFLQSYNSRRTFFNFTGAVFPELPVSINSLFTSIYGAPVSLTPVVKGTDTLPARLVLCLGQSTSDSTANFYLAPEGDFMIQLVSPVGIKDNFLMCGLQGTEFFQITSQTESTAGDTFRFISRAPAIAPFYPFQQVSPVLAPQDPNAPLMGTAFTTSWTTILPTSGNTIKYVSQPKGSSLFGNSTLITENYDDLFGHSIPGFSFTADDKTAFPMVPYAGAFAGDGSTCFTKDQIQDYERVIIGPTRRKQAGLLSTEKSLLHSSAKLPTDAVRQTATTPSGLLVTVTTSKDQTQWNEILLGQNTDPLNPPGSFKLGLVNPVPKLVEAMQTSDLFLVATNATSLDDIASGGTAAFNNMMSIGGWGIQANVGQNPGYGDYKNVMIIKGKKGKLFDPDGSPESNLIDNPNKWTQRNDFSAPTVLDANNNLQPADPNQMVILSQWLHDYFSDAANQKDHAYFDKFNAIATSEDWTGILFLRVDIKKLPDNLSGIVAGVNDKRAFNAHHLAIEISPVKKNGTDASLDHPSTIFGLIYYVDPEFSDVAPYMTITPMAASTYDFRLLTLKVLFENTAVKSFESYAQLTLTKLFGSLVNAMGDPANIYDNVLLKGSFQMNGNVTSYNLGSAGDNLFFVDSNIVRKIEIQNASLTSRPSGDPAKAVSWFSLQGFIDYLPLGFTTKDKFGDDVITPFDLFSFGVDSQIVTDKTIGKGLYFSGLGIEMDYSIADPANKSLGFNPGEITFDGGRSTPRNLSLFTNFALDETTFVQGTKDNTPEKLGFLNVIPDMRLSGVDGSEWFGLKFLLKMGTPGELAGKVNLDAHLLLAWTPASSGTDAFQSGIYIALPGTAGGAKLISLQNVLKLSIGQIRLVFDNRPNAKPSQQSFLMMFTEIALKFLGMIKIPPAGSTLFYLFGNPVAEGKASGLGWYAMYAKDKSNNEGDIQFKARSLEQKI